jgi:D-alanyl-D-alanine dipeptidase
MPGAQLKLVYAYRHPDVQTRYFERESAKIREQYPALSEEEIAERTHCLIAVPEVAGHPTGGAVDLTIIGPHGPLDMGTGIADFADEDLIRFFSTRVTDEQRENRAALRSVMIDERVGFAPFDGEWWHFSYGDREWAAYYALPKAIYGPISADTTAELLRTSVLPR